jgi:hypothetical protein
MNFGTNDDKRLEMVDIGQRKLKGNKLQAERTTFSASFPPSIGLIFAAAV